MIELIHGDCMEYMAKMPDKAYDLAITSPPYNANLRIRGNEYCSANYGSRIKYSNFSDDLSMEEYEEFLVSIIKELVRVTKRYVFLNIQMLSGNKPALFGAIGRVKSILKEVIIWDKVYTEPAVSDGVLNSCFEFIFVFSQSDYIRREFDGVNFKRGTMDNILRVSKKGKSIEGHKAVMPKSIPFHILNNFAQPKDIILEPFLGSGTTAIVCHDMGYDLVGIEIDKEYYDAAVKRLDNHKTTKTILRNSCPP